MGSTMDEVPEILLCEVANEVEAALVVNLLNEDGIPAEATPTQAMNVFGGLPFEPGHKIFVAASLARKALHILGSLSALQEPQERACASLMFSWSGSVSAARFAISSNAV